MSACRRLKKVIVSQNETIDRQAKVIIQQLKTYVMPLERRIQELREALKTENEYFKDEHGKDCERIMNVLKPENQEVKG